MKKTLFISSLFVFVICWAGCKKCYNCHNECSQCTLVYNTHTFTQIICRDSFNTETDYKAAVSSDTSLGYTCASTSPTYSKDFCVSKPGETNYPDYYDKGGRATCIQK